MVLLTFPPSAIPPWLSQLEHTSPEHERAVNTCWPAEIPKKRQANMADERPTIRRKVTTDITHSISTPSTPAYRQSATPLPQRPTVSRPPSRTRYDSPVAGAGEAPKARVNLATISTPTSSTRTPTRASILNSTPVADSSPNVTTRRVRSPVPVATPSISQRVTAKTIVTPTPRTAAPTIARVRSAGTGVPSPKATPPPTLTSTGQVYRQASAPVPAKSALTKQESPSSSSEIATSPSSGSSLSRRPSDAEGPRARFNVSRGSLPAEREYDETSIWLDVHQQPQASSGLTVPRPTHERRNSSNHLQLDADALPSFEPGSFEDRIHIPTQVPSAVPPHLRSPTTHISAPNSPMLDRGGHSMQQSLTPDLKAIKLEKPRASGGYMTYHPPPLPLPPSSPNLRCAPLPDVDGDDGSARVPGLTLGTPAAPLVSDSEDGMGEDGWEDDEQDEDEVANEAKVNRKVQDLEISNGSLLALNNSLEAANAQYRLEIRRLRRLTRGGSPGVLTPERRGHPRTSATLAAQSESDDDDTEPQDSESDDGGFSLDRHAQSEVVLDRLVALVDVMRTRAGRSLEERGYSAGLRVLGPDGEVRS